MKFKDLKKAILNMEVEILWDMKAQYSSSEDFLKTLDTLKKDMSKVKDLDDLVVFYDRYCGWDSEEAYKYITEFLIKNANLNK